MKKFFAIMILVSVFSFSAYAQQVSVSGLPSGTPQNVTDQYIKLDNIKKNADAAGDDETSRRAQSAMDYIKQNVEVYNQDLADDLTPTLEAAYKDGVNETNQVLINNTEEILNEGVPSNNGESALGDLKTESQNGIIKTRGDNLPSLGGGSPLDAAGKSLPEDSLLVFIVTEVIASAEDVVFNKVYPKLSEALTGVYFTFVTLWIIFFGFKLARGMEAEPMKIVIQFMAFAFMGSVIGGGGSEFVQGWILQPLLNASLGMAGMVVSATTDVGGDAPAYLGALAYLEQLFFDSFTMANAIFDTMWESAGALSKIKAVIVGGFIWVVIIFNFTFLVIVYSFMFIYAIMALYLLLSFAPIFLVFAAFPLTRNMFITWLKGVINYVTIPTIAAFALALFIGVMKIMWEDLLGGVGDLTEIQVGESSGEGGEFPWYNLIAVLIVVKLSSIMALRVGDISAFLTGGVSSNLGAAIQSAAKPFAAATALATGAGKMGAVMAGGKALGAGVGAYQKFKNSGNLKPTQKGGTEDFLVNQ